ncbi:hypothetical protein [Actinopolymorpha pittospori]|uniref:Uncharacterized protein n=1 Tax=Actinopolymorpha pittospori TaxID=648752 RepID=A0A927MZD5_9ACTN|nr:hypothetical protein [Actinopolymorpha pittospori]MBE1608093.1 hypothetical protein [Actinopolymorpha pittospori]
MTPGRRRVPSSTWIALAVVTAVVGWALWWLAGDLVTVDNGPDPASREQVAAQLAGADGVAMVLPVKLPDGYDVGRHYSYTNDEEAAAIDGEPTHAASREVIFFPHGGVGDLPAVALCVEDGTPKPSACPHPGARNTYIQRRHGHALLTMYTASVGDQDLSAWKTVDLTTDLNKVTWLH